MDSQNLQQNNSQSEQWNTRVLKKGSEANFIEKIYRFFWFILPIFFMLLIFVMLYVWYKYYDLASKQWKLEKVNASYSDAISNNQSFIWLVSNYSKTLEKYNEYTASLVNYPILFKTVEKYIPKDMVRSSMTLEKVDGWNIKVLVNWKIEWYDSYLSLLTVVDKCNFMDQKQKDDFLALSKVELSEDGKNLGNVKSLSLNFVFNMQKNKILGTNFYKTSLKKFDQYWNYLYLQNITSWVKQDVWSENGIDYKEPLNKIIEDKNKYSEELSNLAKIDSNWFYIGWKVWNFIFEYKDQNKIFDFIIKDLQTQKTNLNILLSDLFDDWIVKFKWKKDTKEKNISDLKSKVKKQIINIDKEISYLTLLQRYNTYLLSNNHQLDTFENLKKKNSKDFDKVLANTIKENKILEDNDLILEPFIWETKTDKEKGEKSKTAYVELYNFVKDADKKKIEYLDVKKRYIDTYYSRYYDLNMLNWFYEIVSWFIDNWYDESLMNKITYKSFNFNTENTNANFSYKKRFYLTLKNDLNTRKYIRFLSNEKEFSKNLIEYEDFIKQEDDLVTYNNSKINCLKRDIKQEIKAIYTDLLTEQTRKTENDKKTKELNIIINTLQ